MKVECVLFWGITEQLKGRGVSLSNKGGITNYKRAMPKRKGRRRSRSLWAVEKLRKEEVVGMWTKDETRSRGGCVQGREGGAFGLFGN